METTAAPLTTKRPIVVTLVCILCAFGAVGVLRVIFVPPQAAPTWYRYFLIAELLVGLAYVFGFWLMKRWALYLYVLVAIANLLMMSATGWWSVTPIVVGVTMIGIMSFYARRMT